jgi:Protein kinase domain
MDALQPGDPELVGQDRLLHRLGSGGMGRVYLGQSPGGVMVAVKLIRPDLAGNADFRRRFAQEVEAAKRVSGPFTAPVIDADPDGPQPWLVTGYVAGPSLADAVASHGPFSVTSVRTLAAGLAGGLGTVHAAGLVHRDLKPSNVVLAIDGPRIIDFGISWAADSAWLSSHDRVVGSPGFMSPEQAAGHDVGPAADNFSLGGVLAFAASGRPPFGTGPAPALLYRVVYGSASLGHVPAELRPVIERCLAKDPAARPTTGDLLDDLGSAARSGDWLSRYAPFFRIQQAAVGAGSVPPADGSRPARRRPLADHTRPARYPRYARYVRPWHSKAALAAWSLALVLAAGGASGAMLAGHHPPHQPARVSAGALPRPHTAQRKHIALTAPPRAVVLAFFAAINARRWHQVRELGGINLSRSYHAMIAGYAGTVRDEIESVRADGDHVTVELRALQAGGVVRSYRISYEVRGGVIAAGTVLASSVVAAPASPQLAGPAEPRTRPGDVARIGSVPPRLAGNALVHLDVPVPGGGDDVGRDVGAWRFAVPAGDGGGPVAQVLLVQVPLRPAGSPFGSRPEPG